MNSAGRHVLDGIFLLKLSCIKDLWCGIKSFLSLYKPFKLCKERSDVSTPRTVNIWTYNKIITNFDVTLSTLCSAILTWHLTQPNGNITLWGKCSSLKRKEGEVQSSSRGNWGLPSQLLSFRDFLREIKNMDLFGGGKRVLICVLDVITWNPLNLSCNSCSNRNEQLVSASGCVYFQWAGINLNH